MKKTEPEYYPPVENLLDLIYEHYTENNPVEKNTVAGKAAKAKEKELEEWLRDDKRLEEFLHSEPHEKRNIDWLSVTFATAKRELTIVCGAGIYYTIHKRKKQHEIPISGQYKQRECET